jgi:hypothetical protein
VRRCTCAPSSWHGGSKQRCPFLLPRAGSVIGHMNRAPDQKVEIKRRPGNEAALSSARDAFDS